MGKIKSIFRKETAKKIDKVFAETRQIFKDNPEIETQFINDKGTYDAKSIETADHKNILVNKEPSKKAYNH